MNGDFRLPEVTYFVHFLGGEVSDFVDFVDFVDRPARAYRRRYPLGRVRLGFGLVYSFLCLDSVLFVL